LKVTAAGTVSIAIADSGSNGLAVDKSGNLFGAVHKDGSISRFNLASGMATPVVSSYGGARFDSPNDLAVRSDGNIYFSDPNYQSPQPSPQPQTHLYRLAPGAAAPTVVDPNQQQPNGVTLSVDENTLYVTWPAGVYRYPLTADGVVQGGTLFTSSVGNGDGMAIDCGGNLYVASNNNIIVLNSTASEIHRFTLTDVQSVTNAAFGGADHKTLYITALGSQMQKGLFKIDLAIPGLPY
jgi:gluconolactonase